MLYPAQLLPNHGTSITGSAQAALKRNMNTTQQAGHYAAVSTMASANENCWGPWRGWRGNGEGLSFVSVHHTVHSRSYLNESLLSDSRFEAMPQQLLQ